MRHGCAQCLRAAATHCRIRSDSPHCSLFRRMALMSGSQRLVWTGPLRRCPSGREGPGMGRGGRWSMLRGRQPPGPSGTPLHASCLAQKSSRARPRRCPSWPCSEPQTQAVMAPGSCAPAARTGHQTGAQQGSAPALVPLECPRHHTLWSHLEQVLAVASPRRTVNRAGSAVLGLGAVLNFI